MSNTTNLNLFKHDNPEQNTNAFDVEEALNKNWDKIDTYAGNVNEDITEINSVIESISEDISDIQTEQTTQNTNIQENADNISSLDTRVGTNENSISNINTTIGTIQTEQTTQNNKISALETDNTTNKNNIATLQTDSGHSILLELNTTTYVLTATLKNKQGTTLNTSSIDLPVEQLVVSVSYDENTKELIITLKNGEITRVPLGDLVSGLQTEITSSNKLSSDLVDDTNHTHKFVSAEEKETWNAKYNKPSGGIPKTDLTTEVQTSLEKADTALQQHQDISGKEDKSNKVTSIDDESTDMQYPSAKCVYDSQQNQNAKIVKLELENQRLKQTLLTTSGSGENITLNKTAELDFVVPPLPEGNTKQNTTEGKNKLVSTLDIIKSSNQSGVWQGNVYTYQGLTFTAEPNIIKINGTSSAQTNFSIASSFVLNAGKYYFYLFGHTSSVQANFYLRYDNNNDLIIFRQADTNVGERTFSEEKQIQQVYLNIPANSTFNNVILKTQISTTENDTWEEYTNGASPNPEYPQEVQVVKGDVEVKVENINILNPYEIFENQINAGLIQIQDDGKIILNGTINSSNRTLKKTKLKAGTYNGIEKLQIVHFFWLGTDGFLQRNYSITLNEDKEIQGYISDGTYNNVELQPMIYTGNYVANKSYTPHQEQTLPLTLGDIELCKIGDYKDYFYKDNSKWYLHKEIGRVLLDGVNNKVNGRTGATANAVYNSGFITNILKPLNHGKLISIYCEGFIARTVDYLSTNNVYGIGVRTEGSVSIGMTLEDDRNTVQLINTWLSNNNLELYYPLETPTNTEITDTTLISQLEAIYNAISYYEQTNISGTSSGISPLFDVEAYQNTKLLLENALNRLELLEN